MSPTKTGKPIVSSSHLVSNKSVELSELEFALIIANNAFSRWVIRCMNAAGGPDLNALDILILHNINHRDRAKKLADICFTLNIEDSHTAAYSLRKLVKLKLLNAQRQGKETFYQANQLGQQLCIKYREVREDCLIESLGSFGASNADIGELATLLRSLSGLYDQAARAATSL